MSDGVMTYEDWLRGCVYHDGRHGYVTLPCEEVLKIADFIERLRADRKTEPTISKMEQVDWKDQMWTEAVEDEPQHKCIDCKFLTYMFGKTWCNIKCDNPHDEVCDRFKPKDEPQTDCAWAKPLPEFNCKECKWWSPITKTCHYDGFPCKYEPIPII